MLDSKEGMMYEKGYKEGYKAGYHDALNALLNDVKEKTNKLTVPVHDYFKEIFTDEREKLYK